MRSFAKNAGMGLAIPYLHNGELHDYVPDFLNRHESKTEKFLILETKGHDDLADLKTQAANRWCSAVNALGTWGEWHYRITYKTDEIYDISLLRSVL